MRHLKYLVAGVASFLVLTAHADTAYPDRPVRLVIPYAAGGTTDIIGRVLAEKLGQKLGQTVVVENKAGANSMIGTSQVARAKQDGYTLLLTSNVVVINEFLYSKPTYHAVQDLAPIAPVVSTPYFLIVNSKLPVKSTKDFVNYAKAHPGEIAFGSSGTGGTPHLVGELFQLRTGTKLLHVPYKGTGPAANDLAAGQVQAMFVGLPAVEAFVRQGTMRVLATAEENRSALQPEIPTIKEEGFPGVYATNWFGILGPKGLAPEVVNRIDEATAAIVKTEEFRKRMESLGAEPMAGADDIELDTLFLKDRDRWQHVIEVNKLKIE